MKLLLGLVNVVPSHEIGVIVNTGDNMYWNGLYICPDVDSVIYALSGHLDLDRMWGIKGDTFNFMKQAQILGLEDTWFNIGDRDLAMHILRTYLMSRGYRLTEVIRYVASRLQISTQVLPMTDQHVETHILTEVGDLHIQEFLVKYGAQLEPLGINYVNIEHVSAPPEVVNLLKSDLKLVIIGPSSPPVSILPILRTKPIGELLEKLDVPRVAVSPIVKGRPVHGLTDKLLRVLGVEPSVVGVAEMYRKYITHMVIDRRDAEYANEIKKLGIDVIVTDIVMQSVEESIRLAKTIIEKVV